ncbi:uncharacterized protein LOC122486660 [Prionailurus bengalensis]|uniref:uncharacterized protein LOC122486660 n=1 Tax=Prionailurus bengalensis TaxID=37029 RepID=UPI001CA9A71D|nr:uncharacterized protein LOC122486660 [Prionailurus bengalensis]
MEPPGAPEDTLCVCFPVRVMSGSILSLQAPFLLNHSSAVHESVFFPSFLPWTLLKRPGGRVCCRLGEPWGPGFRPVPCEAGGEALWQWSCGSRLGDGGPGARPGCRGPRGQLSLRGAMDSSLLNRGWQVPRRRPLSPFVLVQSFLGPRAAGPSTWTPRLRTDARHVSRAGEGPVSLELGRRICSPTPSTGPASRIGGRGPPRSSGGSGTGGAVTKARSRCSVTTTRALSLYPPPRVPAALPAHRPPRGALGLLLLTPHREGKLLWTGFRPHRSLCLSLTSRLSLPHLLDLSAVVSVDGACHSVGWGLLLSLLT